MTGMMAKRAALTAISPVAPAGLAAESRADRDAPSQQPARIAAPRDQQPTCHALDREAVHASAGQGVRALRPAAEDRRADQTVALAAAFRRAAPID